MNAPDGALVADAWLRVVSGLPASCVGPTLPTSRREPVPDWVGAAFVQHTVVGGAPATDTPFYRPVVQVDVWATTLDDRTPPWGRASAVAERIILATYADVQAAVSVPDGYTVPVVRTVKALTVSRKVTGDPAGFAHFTFDLEIAWALSTLAL